MKYLEKFTFTQNLMSHYFKIALILFMIWIGYCAYNISQKDRFQFANKTPLVIIDSHTGAVYIFRKDHYVMRLLK